MKLPLLGALIIAATAAAPKPRASTTRLVTPCRAADAYTADQIVGLKRFIAATDSLTVAFRVASHIPIVPDTSIQVVTDSTKCALALVTYNADMDLGGATATSVYLIRAGKTYIGSNPLYTHGELTSHLVMDSTFTSIAGYLR